MISDLPVQQRPRRSILMCCDGAYLQHVAVFLVSLATHNPTEYFDVVIATDDLTPDLHDRFRRSIAFTDKLDLRFSKVIGDNISDLPIHATLTKESWARLWVDEYFDPSVEYVFYFDPDMIVTGSMTPFLDTNLGDALLAAVTIPGSTRAGVHGYDELFGYFNSGVLIFNMARWRAINPRERLIAYTAAYPDRVNDPDQDALNGCFFGDRLPLDYVWNAITPFFRETMPAGLDAGEVRRIRNDCRIVHFNGLSKPWTLMCSHPRKRDYLVFLRRTAWRDYRYPDATLPNVLKKVAAMMVGDERLQRIKARLRQPA